MEHRRNKGFFARISDSLESHSVTLAIFKSAYFIGILLYLVAIAQAFVTLSLPIEIRSDKVDVYLRNVSSIVAFALLAQYLITWCAYNVSVITTKRQMRLFRILTFAGGVVSLFKGLVSIYFFINQMNRGMFVAGYYFSDIVAWLSLALFYFAYWNLKLDPHKPVKWFNPNFKRLTRILVLFYVYKAAASGTYTAIRFNHYGYAWTYFLYDAIAWLFLAAFFAAYTCSKLVNKKMQKDKKTIDDDVDQMCNKAARLKYKARRFYNNID